MSVLYRAKGSDKSEQTTQAMTTQKPNWGGGGGGGGLWKQSPSVSSFLVTFIGGSLVLRIVQIIEGGDQEGLWVCWSPGPENGFRECLAWVSISTLTGHPWQDPVPFNLTTHCRLSRHLLLSACHDLHWLWEGAGRRPQELGGHGTGL